MGYHPGLFRSGSRSANYRGEGGYFTSAAVLFFVFNSSKLFAQIFIGRDKIILGYSSTLHYRYETSGHVIHQVYAQRKNLSLTFPHKFFIESTQPLPKNETRHYVVFCADSLSYGVHSGYIQSKQSIRSLAGWL